MPRVTIYTTDYCGFCFAAKRLLTEREIPFEEVDVSGDGARRRWLLEVTGQRTVPQLFIDDSPIGGYRELALLDRSGELGRRVRIPSDSND